MAWLPVTSPRFENRVKSPGLCLAPRHQHTPPQQQIPPRLTSPCLGPHRPVHPRPSEASLCSQALKMLEVKY